MFGGKFNHESRFFADGYELSGIESVNFSYNNSASILKPLGTKKGLTTTTGPVNQTMSLTRVLTYQDPILNYTGDNSLSGSIFYEDGYYGFNSGYLTDYSLNCAVGAVPRVTANFQVASELKSGVDSSSPVQSHPTIDIPTQGSISITCDNSTSNRVIGFDYGVKCNRKAYFTIGEKNIKKVELINPIEYNATVQIDVDDAFMQDANAFFDSKEGKNLVLSIGGRSGTNLQTVTIPNASLVGENLVASAQGSLRLTLNYIGHTGTEDVGAFDSSFTYVFDSGNNIIESTNSSTIPAFWMRNSGDVYDLFIGDNVETIGTYAFDNCPNLSTDLFIKSGVDIIDRYAFQDTSGLKSNLIFEKSDTLNLDDGCFEGSAIVGDLILPNFINNIGKWAFKQCKGLNGILRLPTGIDYINQNVFDNCSNLVGDLTIPDNVTGIGYRAFHQCNNLNGNISIGTGVRDIRSQAFYNCHSLIGNLKIPDATKLIFDDAFGECRGLNGTLTLGTGLYYIAPKVFRNCEQIKGIVTFPTGFDGMGDEAFRYCRNIEGIKFEGNPRYIGGGAFRDCNNLRGDLNLPMKDTVEPSAPKASIYTNAFLNVASLDGNLTLGETNRIYTSAFQGCTNMVGDLKIPDQCYQIEYQAFRWCRNLGPNLYLPNYLPGYNGGTGLKEIKVRAFNTCNGFTGELHISGCEQLTDIWGGAFNGCKFSNQLVLPENIKRIRNSNVFYGNNFTDALRIPSGIKSIGSTAFKNCKKISGVYIDSPVSIIPSNTADQFGAVGTEVGHPYMYVTSRYFDEWYAAAFNDGFPNDYFRGIRVRKGSYDTIIYDSNYSIVKQTSDTIIPGEGDVGGRWYSNQSSPDVYIDIGNRVTSINQYAFNNSSNITGSLFIPNSVTGIGDYAFQNCDGFNRTLEFGDSLGGGQLLEDVGKYAFDGCSNFTGDLIIPDSVNYVRQRAFRNCAGFNGSLKLPSNDVIPWVGIASFENCSNFTGELVIPDNAKSIYSLAFRNCSGFNSLKLGEKTQNINASAFENCSGFSNILEAKGLVRTIGQFAFKNCSNLGGVNLGGNLRTVNQEAFRGCYNMKGEIYINSNITSVSENAFRDCSGINYIKYEAPRSTLGSDALRLQSQTKSSKVLYVSTGEYDNFTGVGFAQAGDPNYYDGNLIRKIRADVNQTEYYDLNYNVIASGVYTTIPEKWMSGSGGYSLEIGNAVNTVDSYAFRDNTNLSGTIVIPGNAKYFEFGVFQYCPNVENYVIGEGVEGFNGYCFEGNSSIKELIFPYSLNYLGQFQFSDCTNLEKIVIPDPNNVGYESQTSTMVRNCHNLRYLSIGNYEWTRKGVINKFAFTKCGQNVTDGELFVGGSIDSIRQKAFRVKTLNGGVDGYPWIKKADIMARQIWFEAFLGQTKLSELVSRDAVKSIGSHAFAECTGLTNVTYNKNEEVRDWAFSGCSNLKNVRFGNNYAETTGPNANWYLEFDSFRYVGENVPGNGTAWIGRSHDRVEKRAFYGDFPWLKTVSCYAREIQDEAFKNQTNLQTFNTSARVKVIGSGIFEGCTSLKSEVKCGAAGLTVGPNAFTGCPLNNVYINTNINNVDPTAFSNDMTGAFYIKNAEANGWTTGIGQGPEGIDLYEWENHPTYIPN